MKYQTKVDETIFVSEIVPERSYMFNQDLKTGLSIIWNKEGETNLKIDNEIITIEEDCAIFLTEFHKIDEIIFKKMNVIQFNRAFYCIDDYDHETGCKGLLFFGASKIPKIAIPKKKKKQFHLLWEVLMMEMEESDDLKLEMLRNLLKRFLILFLRIYKNQNGSLPNDNISIGLIREYNFLVEKNYKELTKVTDYAKLLFKSPKTLSNIFKKFIDRTPIQIINERRLLEAKRLLIYTEKSVQDMAYELNFKDVPSFSNFFSSQIGIPPSKFRLQ